MFRDVAAACGTSIRERKHRDTYGRGGLAVARERSGYEMASIRELVRRPVIQAPMGGGPSCPVLAAAVSDAGGLGFLAAGYKTADEVATEIAATKRLTEAPFGVNVFVPYRPPVDEGALERYLAELEKDASSLGVSLGPSAWTDDEWAAKLDVLLRDPVPVVSFVFGCPSGRSSRSCSGWGHGSS